MKKIILIIAAWLITHNIFAQNLNCIPTDDLDWIIENTIEDGTYPYEDKAALWGTDFEENARVTITAENSITMEIYGSIPNIESFIADSKKGVVFLAYIKPCESYEPETLVECNDITSDLINEEYGGRKNPDPNRSGVEYSDLAYYPNSNPLKEGMLFMPLDDAIRNIPDNNGAAYIAGTISHAIRAYDLDKDEEYAITLSNMPGSFNLGNADFEGMTHLNNDNLASDNYFAIIDEVTRVVYMLEYSDVNKDLNYISSYNISGETSSYVGSSDYGLEGLSYNPHSNKLYVVSEGFLNNENNYVHDIIIFELDVDSNPDLTNLQLTKSREFNLSNKLESISNESQFKDAAAIYHLGKVFIDGSAGAERFLLLSQESKKVLEMDMEGKFYGRLLDVSNGFQPEGVAFVEMDNTRKIVVANEGRKQDQNDGISGISAKINKYANGCVSGNNPKLTPLGFDFTSISISPNPVTNQSAISYNLMSKTKVSVLITNVLGNQIATLVGAEQQQAGLNQVAFDASELPTGVYFCTLKANGKVSTQKFIKAN